MTNIPSDVTDLIDAVDNDTRRQDAHVLLALFQKITGEPPKIWHGSIIGFGEYHYIYESGREGDSPNVGFSPRKARQVLYVMGSVGDDHPLMSKLGKYKTGKGCLYINKLADVDIAVLEDIIALSYKTTQDKYA